MVESRDNDLVAGAQAVAISLGKNIELYEEAIELLHYQGLLEGAAGRGRPGGSGGYPPYQAIGPDTPLGAPSCEKC